MEGDGEILRIEARPANGVRTIQVDANSGQITDESFDSLPEPYRVARYGFSPNQVAITFDDGPDPEWTPEILDVLKREKAPATFFLIGIEADKYADVTSRVYAEGHEIGNHTFTHPDISNLSRRYMQLELNLTERLFASRLGIRTILFRPPYSVDAEPDTEDQVRPLEVTQDLGYTTIGNKVDPNDWRETPFRSGEEIAADVLAHLPPCAANDTRCGNIILLHDGGGNRAETVRALPMIIEGVRAKGLQIVPVYQLLGKTRADVMPPLPANERWTARLDLFAFLLFPLAFFTINWIFFVGDVLMTGRLAFIGTFAIFDRLRQRKYGQPGEAEAFRAKVAVLIPAYNEEKVIERTVRSVLASDYGNLRVIVIDDGSSDRTLEVAHKAFVREEASGRVLILTKPNSGKADALNFGIQHLHDDEEIMVGIDADTVIASAAVSRLVPHFLDPRVAAVAGNAKVGNRVNLWTRWQALEYITSQNFERRALNTLGAVSVVPGAIGAWRVSAVREVGGYQTDTVAEDADLTMALLRERLSRRVRRPGACLHGSADHREWPDAPALSLVVRYSAIGLETSWRLRPEGRFGVGCSAQHRDLPDLVAAGFAANRSDVRWRHDLVLRAKIFPPGIHRSCQLPPAGAVFRRIPDHRLDYFGDRVRAGASTTRSPRRCLAAQPGLAATLRLSPVVFGRARQDSQAGH